MYVSYRVRASLKPEYVEYVIKFVDEHQWSCEDQPQCITLWHTFLKSHGKYKINEEGDIISYENRVPFGLPSEWWGCECVVFEDEFGVHWWSFSGELKNDAGDLQYFLQHVLSELCYEIPICWTCKEGDILFTTHEEHNVRKGYITL